MNAADATEGAGNGVGWDRRSLEQRLLRLENRRRIYEHIVNHPGIYLRELVRATGLALGTVEHHLHLLVKHGLLESRIPGPHRRCYFPRTGVAQKGLELVALVRNATLRAVLDVLASTDDLEALELARRLAIAPATAAYHLNRLVQWEVAETLRLGRARIYRLRDPEAVRKALSTATDPLETAVAASDAAPDPVMEHLLKRIPATMSVARPPARRAFVDA